METGVFSTLGAESRRKCQKSENNTKSHYPFVQKSENPLNSNKSEIIILLWVLGVSDGGLVGRSINFSIWTFRRKFSDLALRLVFMIKLPRPMGAADSYFDLCCLGIFFQIFPLANK